MKNDSSNGTKTCQRCGTVFPCGTENCWCNEFPKIMPLPPGEDCLCPECLRIAIDSKINSAS